jgi:tetratricopeptide (TPR) repeat protein/uncharacterized protein YegL
LFVITAAASIRQNADDTQPLLGVLNVNVLADSLSDSINKQKILHSGYVYAIDAVDESTVIFHPRATASCATVRCVEKGFSDAEYADFTVNVLDKIRKIVVENATGVTVPTYYKKNGEKWRLAYSPVVYGTIQYAVISTVPQSDIQKSSDAVNTKIDSSIVGIIVAAAFTMLFLVGVMVIIIQMIVKSVSRPISDLSKVCRSVIDGDLSASSLPTSASSSDVKIVLQAFMDLMTALRFGSDSYARGNMQRALDVFVDALQLYSAAGNERGVAACHNNLGGVCTALKRFERANEEYTRAIDLAEKNLQALIAEDASATDIYRAKCTLSDRKGNLALLRANEENYPDAYALLEQCIEEDKNNGYISGVVVKQGNMGQLYLKQGELSDAERMFQGAYAFLDQTDERFKNNFWTDDDISMSMQYALFNLGRLHEARKEYALAQHMYIMSIQRPRVVKLAAMMKSITALRSLLPIAMSSKSAAEEALIQLDEICIQHDLVLETTGGGSQGYVKRVSFALDYSGSMAGAKIRSAVSSLQELFHTHMVDDDNMMLLHFNDMVHVDFPLMNVGQNKDMMASKISELMRPNGSTVLYDAIVHSVRPFEVSQQQQVSNDRSGSNDWIVVLTDGADNGSKNKVSDVVRLLTHSTVGAIIIGVGNDVQEHILKKFTDASKKGFLLSAAGDQSSITSAFGAVAKLLEENVIFEDV